MNRSQSFLPSVAARSAVFAAAVFAIALLPVLSLKSAAAPKPNILLILADDLGWSDLGCYGGEISTPNLDALARAGLRFTQFYNAGRCWPTRAALLTGYYPQQVRRDTVPEIVSGGAGVRPSWARLLPEMLQPLGYRSYHSGKWHIDGECLKAGFDHSYRIEDCDRYFGPKSQFEDDRELPPVQPDTGFYATTAIADHAIAFLKDHAAHHAERPFFEYLCFTAPHFPLQAPADDIARYEDQYRRGWDALRAERWNRIRRMGLAQGDLPAIERDLGPPYDRPNDLAKLGSGETNRPVAWNDLSVEQRAFQAAKMAIHAAMVDRMDREIGRVFNQLQSMGAWQDTIILFLSDNGASAEIMVRGDGQNPDALPGSASTFLCLGPGWSSVANTPFRRHKTWVHEGGIATPLIVQWPRGIRASNKFRRTPGHVIDLVPTLLDLVGGVSPPADGDEVPPPPGRSLKPALAGDVVVERDFLWWLHEGNRALRIGDWKLVAARNEPWQLYNLKTDRGESLNLAATYPDISRQLSDFWQQRTDEMFKWARWEGSRGREGREGAEFRRR